ncbi:pentapeptide repeat-containing protein [Mycolicibacterium goodii]
MGGSRLNGVKLEGANLTGVDLDMARSVTSVWLQGATLNGTKISGHSIRF